MSLIVLIIIIVICLLLQGFFSGSEMALVSADKYRLALAVDNGSKRALSALHMVKHPAKFFSTTLLGTNLCTVTGAVAITIFIIDRFGPAYSFLAVAYWPFTLIFGEIVPKSIYQYYADKLVLRVSPILFVISIVFHPAVWLLSKATDTLLGSVKKRYGETPPLSREELELILEVGKNAGSDVKATERTLISRIFDLADKRVKNIMTPLVDVIAVSKQATKSEITAVLEKYGFSRVPIYDGRVFNIVGVLAGTDLLFGDDNAKVEELIKPAYYVPEEMPLDELLIAMKRKGEPLAVAVDEYGGAVGMVTAEDLLEEVVGEIRDEHDDAPTLYKRIGWHHYILSGRMEIDYARERLKMNIPEGAYQTIAGFMIHKMEKIPIAGDEFSLAGMKFIVRRANERAVLEVEVKEEK